MSAFTAVFFSSRGFPGFPLWHSTVQVRITRIVDKTGYSIFFFLTISRYATSHIGQRGTPPGERGREKENRSKNRHFPPPSPLTVFLSGLSFPSPPIPHPLPVFAYIKTSRLKCANARPSYCRDGEPPSAAMKRHVKCGRPLAVPKSSIISHGRHIVGTASRRPQP